MQNEHAQASLVYTKQSMDEKANGDEDRKVHCKSSGKNFANETTCSELEIGKATNEIQLSFLSKLSFTSLQKLA